MNPFTAKQMNNIWDGVTAGYTGFSGKRQWKISQLVLNLQELITSDESQSDLMCNNMGLPLMSPIHGLKCQSQDRLQPQREIATTNAKRKVTTALQFQGFSQSSVDEQNDMMMTLAATK